MAKTDTKQSRIIEIVILLFAIVCIALIVADLSLNLSQTIDTQRNRTGIKTGSNDPAPNATFSSEDFQEFLSRGKKYALQQKKGEISTIVNRMRDAHKRHSNPGDKSTIGGTYEKILHSLCLEYGKYRKGC